MTILSSDQQLIVQRIQHCNLVISAVAGAGKTTTFLFIAKTYPQKRFLLLTYNTRLKQETREKVKKNGLENIEVHSYHSFCTTYFSKNCHTDMGIIHYLKENRPLLLSKNMPFFNILMIDECQDMTPLYFNLVRRIHFELLAFSQIILVGDPYQNIFEFNGADARYLILGNQVFRTFSILPWEKPTLKESFRVTKPMTDFFNKCVFREENRIISQKEGKKPTYFICNVYRDSLFLSNRIQKLLEDSYNRDDIFVIAPSIRSEKTPIRHLANCLTAKGIPIYVPVSDEEKLDLEILRGKIVFSSFHQVKGLERKCVFVYGFDASYFEFFAKRENPNRIPNPLYVAITRAQQELFLIHHNEYDYLPFLDTKSLENYTKIWKVGSYNPKPPKDFLEIQENGGVVSVVDLLRHLSSTTIEKALTFFQKVLIKQKGEIIYLEHKIKEKHLFENVCEINGMTIPLYFSYAHGDFINWEKLGKSIKGYFISDEDIESFLIKIKNRTLAISDMTKFSTFLNAYQTGFYFKTKQISNFQWITEEQNEKCQSRLEKKLSKMGYSEFFLYDEKNFRRSLTGFIDRVEENTIWEFKCVQQLTEEHFLQIAVYKYLYENRREEILQLLDKTPLKMEDILEKIKELDPLLARRVVNLKKRINLEIGSKIGKWIILKKTDQYNLYLCQKKGKEKRVWFSPNQLILKQIKVDAILSAEWEYLKESLKKGKVFQLWNILDDEQYQIDATLNNLKSMVQLLMDSKYGFHPPKTDQEFMETLFDDY